jgi:hypothetical protein
MTKEIIFDAIVTHNGNNRLTMVNISIKKTIWLHLTYYRSSYIIGINNTLGHYCITSRGPDNERRLLNAT